MDHKRGFYLLDQPKHAADHAARKRQKDLSHSSAATSPQFPLEGPSLRGGRAGSSANDARALVMNKEELDSYLNPGKSSHEMDKTVEDCAYKRLLPVVKRELEYKRDMDMAQSRRAVKRLSACEMEEKICAICPYPKKFKGWDALLIHAEKFNKENARQHRGYFRALKQALQEEEVVDPKKGVVCKPRNDIRPIVAGATLSGASAGETGEGRPDWKPNILIVENSKLSEVERIICPEMEHRETEDGLHACHLPNKLARPRLKEILAVYSTGDDDKRNVFVFPATEVGYIDGKELKDTCHLEHGFTNELGFHCDDHRALAGKLEDKKGAASIYAMTVKGWTNMKEKHGLKLWPEDEVYDHRGELFDNSQFDRINKIMTRWTNSFKAINRKFEVQRSFREGRKMHDLDRVWQEDLKRIEGYTPATKKKVRDQMSAIEGELRKEHLVWLQEVEAVREQFQRMADNMKKEEEASNLRNLRREEENIKKQQKLEHERVRHDNLHRMQKLKATQSTKKYKHSTDSRLLMETWNEEYERLWWESHKAKAERVRLQNIHEKVHHKAFVTRKRECPICFERLRKDSVKDLREPFSQYYPVSKLCLNMTCPKRH